MKARYRLIRRGIRGNVYYCVDSKTGKRTSLRTNDEDEAQQILDAKNQSQRQPLLNLQIAKAYLTGKDSKMTTRTWGDALQIIISEKSGATQRRWQTVEKDKALSQIFRSVIVDTESDELIAAAKRGTVSTKVFLRRLHNFCVRRIWIPAPIVPEDMWPVPQFKEKRAITLKEHRRIVNRERNPERKAFYELAWLIGASQSDLANLTAANIDKKRQVISYIRRKTRLKPKPSVAQLRFGTEVAAVLKKLPKKGPLFPYLRSVREADRATEFRQRCQGLKINGVTLHSYRYAWAERAMKCAYPERFAQLALGHQSRAVHLQYAKNAEIPVPALEDYETNGKRTSRAA